MKFVLPLIAALSMSACVSTTSGSEVSRAFSGVSSCAHLDSLAANRLQGESLRCGPQTQLPYTMR